MGGRDGGREQRVEGLLVADGAAGRLRHGSGHALGSHPSAGSPWQR